MQGLSSAPAAPLRCGACDSRRLLRLTATPSRVAPRAAGGCARRLVLASAAGRPSAADPQLWTRLNKPVVREAQTVGYGTFLADVRAQAVKEVVLTHEGTHRALVVYKDGRVRYCQFPADDPRLGDVLATYGVVATQAAPEPALPDTPRMRQLKDAAMYWIPAALILVVYAVVQNMARNKGDFEDRVKLRQLAESERREAKEREVQEALEDAQTKEPGPGTPGGGEMSMDEAKTFLGVSAKRVRARDVAADAAAEAEAEEAATDASPPGTLGAAQPPRKRKPRSTSLTSNLKLRRDERVTFADVAGIGAAKVELMEVVDFFLKPEKYKRSGSRVPKGVLLVGPPGTGKTLLARAVAGEAGVDFFSITASEFVEMFVGVGAARVRSLFEQAKAAAPAIVFIDELDAVGRKRGGGGSGNDERDQTLNQLLSELDGFDASKRGLVVIAATNRPDVLDAALVRAGRFDRKVFVPAPDAAGRLDILRVHTRGKPLAGDVDLALVAAETRDFTGAALANLVNVAALGAAREGAAAVSQRHLAEALEAETLGKPLPGGAQPRLAALTRRLAVHRAAAALAAELLPQLPGVELVSVAPRENSASGFLRCYVDEAREATGVRTAAFAHDQLVAALAPRAAEEAEYGRDGLSVVNAGLLGRARALASAAVLQLGFAAEAHPLLGRRALAYSSGDSDFLGRGGRTWLPTHLGEAAYAAADGEVAARLEDAYAEAQRMVAAHRPQLRALTDALEQRGTLSGDEVRLLAGNLRNKHTQAAVDVGR